MTGSQSKDWTRKFNSTNGGLIIVFLKPLLDARYVLKYPFQKCTAVVLVMESCRHIKISDFKDLQSFPFPLRFLNCCWASASNKPSILFLMAW